MNMLLLFWLSASRAAGALVGRMGRADQRDAERYLAQSQSFADLESRERYWLQSQ